MVDSREVQKLEPLDIKCTSTDCENGLHCWRVTKRMAKKHQEGRCIDCGVELVDWARVHRQDLEDVAHTFSSLKKELIRHHFWHIPFDEHAVNAARRLGRQALGQVVEHKIRQRVGPAHPYRDGGQTPLSKDPVAYAQHATASCCRKCIHEWHGIPEGRDLTDGEVRYLAALAEKYLDERLPDLADLGVKVPPIRTAEGRANAN